MRLPVGLLRCKLICAEKGQYVIGALVLVSLLSFAAAGVAFANPPIETVTEQRYTQTVATSANTSAVVVRNSTLWENGSRLEGRSFYPLPHAPNLTLHVRTTVPEGEAVEVTHRLSVVYRVTDSDEELWNQERTLVEESAPVEGGEATTTATVDTQRLATRRDTINEDMTGIGRTEISLRLTTDYDTGRYAGELTTTVPLSIGSKGYRVQGSFDARKVHSTPVSREVPRDNAETYLGLVAIGLLSAVGAAGAGRVYYYEDVVGDDIRVQIERTRHAEWISEGRLRQPLGGDDIEMKSLGDLVDVAIDSDRRVVHDPVRDLYAVVDRDTIYYYVPGGEWGPFVFGRTPALEPDPGEPTTRADGSTESTTRTNGSAESTTRADGSTESKDRVEGERVGSNGPDTNGSHVGSAGSHDPWGRLLDVESVTDIDVESVTENGPGNGAKPDPDVTDADPGPREELTGDGSFEEMVGDGGEVFDFGTNGNGSHTGEDAPEETREDWEELLGEELDDPDDGAPEPGIEPDRE